MFRLESPGPAGARFALVGAVLGIVWVTMFLRLWVRIRRSFTRDDGVCLVSAVSGLLDYADIALTHIASLYGLLYDRSTH